MFDASEISKETFKRLKRSRRPVICNVSNRHAHLRQDHIEKLFGPGYTLKALRGLMQPGEFASTVTIDVMGPKSILRRVRVLGPARGVSQIELSRTDTYVTGLAAELRESGNISGSIGCRIIGPAGSVELPAGVIVARRHIHMTPDDALFFDLQDKDVCRVRTPGPRGLILSDVLVRVSPSYSLECHIDTDEANACDLKSGTEVTLC